MNTNQSLSPSRSTPLTLEELINLLLHFAESNRGSLDMPVAYTFESVVVSIALEDIYISADGVLMIGDDYQDEFKTGAMRAREDWPESPL